MNGTPFIFNTRNTAGGFWSNGGTDGDANLNNSTPGGSVGFTVKMPTGNPGSFGAPNTSDMYNVVSSRHNGTEGITDFKGLVGIGISNPTEKLQVFGTTSNLFTVADNTTTGSIFSVNNISGIPYLDINATTNVIALGPSSGNIGIGTTAPTEKLHVQGNILSSGTITAGSDIKLKTNIQTIPNALNKILQLIWRVSIKLV